MFFVCVWVALGGVGGLSCGNPFSVLHRGDVFLGFQKHQLMISVCCWRFSRRFCATEFHPVQWLIWHLPSVCCEEFSCLMDVCGRWWMLLHVGAHVRACMPPCSPLRPSGNLSIEIRKKNSREEFLWFSQGGIYNGLQAALTSPSLSPCDSCTLKNHQ